MKPLRTLEDARAAFVDEVLRRDEVERTHAEQAALRRQMEDERRRASFRVVRPCPPTLPPTIARSGGQSRTAGSIATLSPPNFERSPSMAVEDFGFESAEDLPYTPVPDPDRVGPGAIMTKQQFCNAFGIARYDLDRAIANGGPVLHRGGRFEPWQIPAGDMLRWMIADKAKTVASPDLSPLRQNQIRLIISQCEKVEMKNAEMRSQLVTVNEAVTVYGEEMGVVRKHVCAVPDAVVKALAALKPEERSNASIVGEVIADVINDALQAISTED